MPTSPNMSFLTWLFLRSVSERVFIDYRITSEFSENPLHKEEGYVLTLN